MDRQLRDLLDAAAGEPPHQVTVDAVRRRVTRHRAMQCLSGAAVAAAAAVALVATVGFTGARFAYFPSTPPAVHAPLQGNSASYLGVFEVGSAPSYGPVGEFAKVVGKEPNLIGYYSGWEQPFPLSVAETMYRHGLIPLVQVDPTLASVSAIASGVYDGYLSAYAVAVRAYGHSVVIGFGHEMNATWYPWGYTHTPAPTFVAAWRHIVTLFRALDAVNVTWLWTIRAGQPGTGPMLSWWPGAHYVTWVGIDGFYTKPSDTFNSVFVPTIDQVRTFTDKPILLSETAVALHANQYANILNLFNGVAQYQLLGLVWLDNDESQKATPQGDPEVLGRDWRFEDSPLGERAFRLAVSGLRLVQP
jgi:mannan endo-1,4-beta-mannosidase